MPLYNDDFHNEESGKKRPQGVVELLLSDYLLIENQVLLNRIKTIRDQFLSANRSSK